MGSSDALLSVCCLSIWTVCLTRSLYMSFAGVKLHFFYMFCRMVFTTGLKHNFHMVNFTEVFGEGIEMFNMEIITSTDSGTTGTT